jgi:hypothetical protein
LEWTKTAQGADFKRQGRKQGAAWREDLGWDWSTNGGTAQNCVLFRHRNEGKSMRQADADFCPASQLRSPLG